MLPCLFLTRYVHADVMLLNSIGSIGYYCHPKGMHKHVVGASVMQILPQCAGQHGHPAAHHIARSRQHVVLQADYTFFTGGRPNFPQPGVVAGGTASGSSSSG